MSRFDAAPFIKDIGRGSQHPTSLSRERAIELWTAMLADELEPVALGGALIALRVKGETADEMAGFLAATRRFKNILSAGDAWPRPVVIASYNGARKLPNLTPLLALLLARERICVLVHGSLGGDIPKTRAQRVTSAAIFEALGLKSLADGNELAERWNKGLPGFIAIDALHPELARILSQRAVLGVRNSSHTLVKLLQPFDRPALCLSSYTHPEYLNMLSDLLLRGEITDAQDTLLLRATEGEAVANARRAVPMQWIGAGGIKVLEPDGKAFSEPEGLPADCSIESTVTYIDAVLAGRLPVPAPIAWQVATIQAVLRSYDCRATV
jgi:anthranilate phosphoribosyltransferase